MGRLTAFSESQPHGEGDPPTWWVSKVEPGSNGATRVWLMVPTGERWILTLPVGSHTPDTVRSFGEYFAADPGRVIPRGKGGA